MPQSIFSDLMLIFHVWNLRECNRSPLLGMEGEEPPEAHESFWGIRKGILGER